MDTDTEEQAARKAKTLPFGGRIDPLREAKETVLPIPLIQRGTPMVPMVTTTSTPLPVQTLTTFEVAQALMARGMKLTPDMSSTLMEIYSGGILEDQLDGVYARLTVRTGLRVVVGGGV
ncbi:hypothetical protein [Candidatus Aalborgicola defluviihabitans]|uniref:hypothetical protein n=1 Tax=Candidatus Aalborgicola defluviihabitans TaxID=3386187 RepID=UPI001D6B2D79|nr:hypothetical protein [Burkholderiales bacterium]